MQFFNILFIYCLLSHLLVLNALKDRYCKFNHRNLKLNAFANPSFSISSIQTLSVSSFDGTSIKMVTNINSTREKEKSPLLFIHGSFHNSWCFEENFLPYFTQEGFPCYIVSLRGTSGSHLLTDKKKVKIDDHVEDITVILKYIQSRHRESVKVISHSFGGLITMKLLEESSIRDHIAGVCLLASIPPSGNGPMTLRFLRKSIINSLKIVLGFVFKRITSDYQLARELFFDAKDFISPSQSDLIRYIKHFEEDSVVTVDLIDLKNKLPSITSMDSITRQSNWINTQNKRIDALVVGGERDFIVDLEGIDETATYFQTSPVVIPNMYHDCMLGSKWKLTAQVISNWLKTSTID